MHRIKRSFLLLGLVLVDFHIFQLCQEPLVHNGVVTFYFGSVDGQQIQYNRAMQPSALIKKFSGNSN